MDFARTAGVAALGLSLALGACATLQKARDRIVKPTPRCLDQTVQVYFEAQSAEVTKEGRAVIAQAASAAKGCVVKDVEVLGLADAAGDPNANLELSKKRAQSVSAALAAAGLPAAELHMSAAGQSGASTPDGANAPMRRRADVVLHLAVAK
ncbi:MAG: OmpA family protein [Phenylobacterium sp.]